MKMKEILLADDRKDEGRERWPMVPREGGEEVNETMHTFIYA